MSKRLTKTKLEALIDRLYECLPVPRPALQDHVALAVYVSRQEALQLALDALEATMDTPLPKRSETPEPAEAPDGPLSAYDYITLAQDDTNVRKA